jgi:hypothetical protein
MAIYYGMHVKILSRLQRLTSLLLTCALSIVVLPAHADNGKLLHKYIEIRPALENNVYGLPVYIQSSDQDNTMLGEIYGVIHHAFDSVKDAITAPESWCEIVPQHLNIKACTYQRLNEHYQLTFYAGRKYYESTDDAHELSYRYELTRNETDYFQATLIAETGPMGTSDYLIEVEAMPLNGTETLIHFSYSYKYSFLAAIGMKIYLATLGRDKTGFTATGKDNHGHPESVKGIRGIIERNTVRYYFAIQSFLDTIQLPPGKRFNARLNTWFDLTEKYPLQLHEIDRADYLAYKQMEHNEQLQLQQQVNDSLVTK